VKYTLTDPVPMDEELPPRNGRGRGSRRGRGRGRNRSRSNESGTVYIENLNFDTSWQDLKDHMKQVGKVKRADVFFDSEGNSAGKGICEYLYAEDVERAVREVDGTELDGRVLRIVTGDSGGRGSGGRSRGRGRNRRENRRGPMRKAKGGPGCRVYVGNLPWETSWQDLKDLMRDVGDVLYADIYSNDEGRSKGSGVVEFSNPDDAQEAIEKMHDYEYNGRNLSVREFEEEENDGGRKVFVGNLNFQSSWQDLKDTFREVGEVSFVKIFEDDDGRSKGSAIIEFEEPLAAQAIEQMNDTMFDGRRIQVREDREEF